MERGKLVTFEGCEGVGKSRQLSLLGEYLKQKGVDYVLTREPGGSFVAEKIRTLILDPQNGEMTDMCELLLYEAARAQHIDDVIAPAIATGKLVLCDRYTDSTVAYQGCAKGLGKERVERLNALTVGSYAPDFTVFLDLPPDVAFSRKGGADKSDRLELLDIEFHRRVYRGYKQIASEQPDRFVAIDASGEKHQTQRLIIKQLESRRLI